MAIAWLHVAMSCLVLALVFVTSTAAVPDGLSDVPCRFFVGLNGSVSQYGCLECCRLPKRPLCPRLKPFIILASKIYLVCITAHHPHWPCLLGLQRGCRCRVPSGDSHMRDGSQLQQCTGGPTPLSVVRRILGSLVYGARFGGLLPCC